MAPLPIRLCLANCSTVLLLTVACRFSTFRSTTAELCFRTYKRAGEIGSIYYSNGIPLLPFPISEAFHLFLLLLSFHQPRATEHGLS
jgi:hypothetical protein